MKSPGKKAIIAGAIVAALALGGASAAVAASVGSSSEGASEHETSFVGTVKAPAETADATETKDATESTGTESTGTETPGTETKDSTAKEAADDAAETALLKPLAKITPDQASAAATKVVPGKVGVVQLEEENGFVVYDVEITGADGTITEVTIDAGNGSVLAQETESATTSNK